jgi:hypothetical protein
MRERVVEGAQSVRPSDLEVEVVAHALVADGDLHSIVRAVPEQDDFQSVCSPPGKLDPAGRPRGTHGLVGCDHRLSSSRGVVRTTNRKRERRHLFG